MAVTLNELNDAQVDAQAFEDIINGAHDRSNPGNPDGTVTTRLGRVVKTASKAILELLNYQGAWSSGVTYSRGAVTTYQGSSYLSLQDANTNRDPSNQPTWWGLLAAGSEGGGDMLRSVYDTDNDGTVDYAENTKLNSNNQTPPTASAQHEGTFYYYKPGGGNPSVLYFCIATGAGSYEWVVSSVSSS